MMDYDLLFRDMKESLTFFFHINHLSYFFDRNKIEKHNEFEGVNYVSLRQYWSNPEKGLIFELSLVHYLGIPLKGEKEHFNASIVIDEYKKNELYRYFSLMDYLMYYQLKVIRLEECTGATLKEKIDNYIENIKEIILPILKGEIWVNSPTYWGNYK